tara:strand:+ start:411 stop:941 length:531 start_codon:yes stop_codon:yes gene_type:complete
MIKFKYTKIKNLKIASIKNINDKRGFFGRLFCKKLFGKNFKNISQINRSFTKKKFTIRGMHYQVPPFSEDKIIFCTKGKIFDVAIDLRKKSKTFGKWHSVILSSKNNKMFLIPKGFAHGFMSLEKNTEIIYFVSQFYNSKKERGVLYKDPFFSIKWPAKPSKISKKDLNWPIIKTK